MIGNLMRKYILTVCIFAILIGFLPQIPNELFSKFSGPSSANWSDQLWRSTNGQLSMWTFSSSYGDGYPFIYLEDRAYGVECEAGGCGRKTIFLPIGLIADLIFYFTLLFIYISIKNKLLATTAFVAPFVLTIIFGYIPYPNRCPTYNDRLQYISVNPKNGETKFKNLEDKRNYMCDLEYLKGNDNEHCKQYSNAGLIAKIDALGIDANMGYDKSCVTNIGGISVNDCDYSCKAMP